MFKRYYDIDWNKVMTDTIVVYDRVYLESYVTPALVEQLEQIDVEVAQSDLTDAKKLLERIAK